MPNFDKDAEKLELADTADGNEKYIATLETVWQFLLKLKIHLPSDLRNPLLGIYPKAWVSKIFLWIVSHYIF